MEKFTSSSICGRLPQSLIIIPGRSIEIPPTIIVKENEAVVPVKHLSG